MLKSFNKRLSALREVLKERGLDAFCITHEENAAYFTGEKGDDCALYITPEEAYIITDFRYREMAEALSEGLTYIETSADYRTEDFFKSRREKFIGIEQDYLSYAEYKRLEAANSNAVLRPVSGLAESLRIIKDEDEIESTRKAAAIADKAFTEICKILRPGISEREAAAKLEYIMRMEGSDGVSFDTILISGSKTSKPHGVSSDKLIEAGDFVTMDYGATVNGYHSDMTRTVGIGSVSDEMKKVYGIVLEAQLNCCAKLKAGMSGKEGDSLARDVIEQAGYGEFFGHGTGHGTGLEIHESPRLSTSYGEILKENMTITIEPGIYIPGRFGVRIEDLAIIKPDGIINLVKSPKDLIIL